MLTKSPERLKEQAAPAGMAPRETRDAPCETPPLTPSGR